MAKATIYEDGTQIAHFVRAEWQEVAEAVGAELHQICISGRPESVSIEFDGYSDSEWKALPEDMRAAMEENGES